MNRFRIFRFATVATAIAMAAMSIARAGSIGWDRAPRTSAGTVKMASPYRPYRLRLFPWVPEPGRVNGVLLKVRIDGGPPLRLLLDSGAQRTVLSRKAAARSGLSWEAEAEIVGPGAGSRVVKTTEGATLEVGGLKLRNCPLAIIDGNLMEDIDGAIPLALFAGFLIRLDSRGRTLELLPYPDAAADRPGFLPAVRDHEMLFLKAMLNDAREGYFLLDTGAATNAISYAMATLLASRHGHDAVSVHGGTGESQGFWMPFDVHFRCGEQVLQPGRAVAVDLDMLSMHHHFEVAGLIGYPTLAASVVTLNYRDALVRIDPQ